MFAYEDLAWGDRLHHQPGESIAQVDFGGIDKRRTRAAPLFLGGSRNAGAFLCPIFREPACTSSWRQSGAGHAAQGLQPLHVTMVSRSAWFSFSALAAEE